MLNNKLFPALALGLALGSLVLGGVPQLVFTVVPVLAAYLWAALPSNKAIWWVGLGISLAGLLIAVVFAVYAGLPFLFVPVAYTVGLVVAALLRQIERNEGARRAKHG